VAPAPIHESVDPFLGMQSTKQNPPTQHAAPTGQNTQKGQTTMSENNGQLTLAEPAFDSQGIKITGISDLERWCKIVAASQLAPKGISSPQAIAVAIQAGMELGLGPMQALQSIAVINGRPTIYGDTALGLVKRHKDFLDHVEPEPVDGVATVISKRRGCSDIKRTYSVDDAKRAGLWGKSGPWTTNPNRMLQLRARSFALRDQFPDVLRGVGIAEEVRDYTPRNVTTRKVAESVVLPEPTNAAEYFASAVDMAAAACGIEPSQKAALEDTETGDLFTKAVRV